MFARVLSLPKLQAFEYGQMRRVPSLWSLRLGNKLSSKYLPSYDKVATAEFIYKLRLPSAKSKDIATVLKFLYPSFLEIQLLINRLSLALFSLRQGSHTAKIAPLIYENQL